MTPAELEALARALDPRARPCSRGWIARCPSHDDHAPSLTLAVGRDGCLLAHCFAGCSFEAIRAELRARGLLPSRDRVPPDPLAALRRREEVRRRELELEAARRARALEAWHAARPIRPGDPVDRYLRARALEPASSSWPACLRAGRDRHGPIMVAAACRLPDRRLAAVQITRLTPDGRKRADTPPVRLTFGPLRAAAVPIRWNSSSTRPVVITEGVEDALAVALAAPDHDVIAALGAQNASRLALPGRELILALDADPPGRAAARDAARALTARGAKVRIAELPPGLDPAALLERSAP